MHSNIITFTRTYKHAGVHVYTFANEKKNEKKKDDKCISHTIGNKR